MNIEPDDLQLIYRLIELKIKDLAKRIKKTREKKNWGLRDGLERRREKFGKLRDKINHHLKHLGIEPVEHTDQNKG